MLHLRLCFEGTRWFNQHECSHTNILFRRGLKLINISRQPNEANTISKSNDMNICVVKYLITIE